MKFFGREAEVDELRGIRKLSKKAARMTVVTGRRRVGKTELVRQALDPSSTSSSLVLRSPQCAKPSKAKSPACSDDQCLDASNALPTFSALSWKNP